MTARATLALLVALVLLNAALTFGNVWPTLWVRPEPALSIELALALLALALVAARRGAPPPWTTTALAALTVLLVLGRYAEVTARELYGRPVNLYHDLPHVPRVAAMFVEAAPAWSVAAGTALAVAGIAALYVLARWAWASVARALARTAPRRWLALAAAGACAAYPFAPGWFADPVSLAYARQVQVLARSLSGAAGALGASPDFSGRFERLGRADVLVIFVESYGAATYERPVLAGRLAPRRALLAAAIASTGRGVVSAFVESPTFGGGSWLAHASLLSGVEVREGDAYNLLLNSRRPSLATAFAERGYRTVALMPGLRQDWREGAAFYRFDAIYGARELDYRGPAFGWWRIPDQYALARLARLEEGVAPGRPRFVFFPTITTHAPFRPTPPYDADWARVAASGPDAAGTGNGKAEWSDLETAYGDAVSYVLAWLAGYVRERAGDDLVLVVLGDHQPPAGVAGERASWHVPVHVITARAGLLDALVAHGFVRGLQPAPHAIARMHELTAVLVAAFGSVDKTRVDVARPAPGG
ncbi:MAG: sulfatase-like hydrolase/transferase [Burkholderiales bacterium]|nr:sulfatase-like hydrolase/transferase [Burkholderiales bacterium]